MCAGEGCLCATRNHKSVPDENNEVEEENDEAHWRTSSTGRQSRRDAVLKDQQSTGRKRAAKMYPLNREHSCEWQGKANCGGGLHPIVGCLQGMQEARHHGPDKKRY